MNKFMKSASALAVALIALWLLGPVTLAIVWATGTAGYLYGSQVQKSKALRANSTYYLGK